MYVISHNEYPRISASSSEVFVVPGVHSHIPTPANTRLEMLESVLSQLQGRDITILVPLGKSYYEKALKTLGIEPLARKYGARTTCPQLAADTYIETSMHGGRRARVKAVSGMLDGGIEKVVIATPTTHSQLIIYLTLPTLVFATINPKDWQLLYEGFKTLHMNVAHVARMVQNTTCIADGKTVVEGDGPIRGFQRHWGLIIYGRDCGEVDYVAAYGLGMDPMDLGYIYFYFNGEPKVDVPEYVEKSRISVKPPSNLGLQLTWKKEL